MNNLKNPLFIGSLFSIFLGVFTAAFSTGKEDQIPLVEPTSSCVRSENVAWDRFKEIGTIWGKNTIQAVDIFGCIGGYDPLPVLSRDSSRVVNYIEDRFGYAFAPLNWFYYINEEHLPPEGPNTMYVRGWLKKYNEEVRKRILPNDHTQ